jgi:hypothetical protein
MPDGRIEDDDGSRRTRRVDFILVRVLRIAHRFVRLSRVPMRPGHETRRAVFGIEGVNHPDATNQRPAICCVLHVDMETLHRCARVERSRAHTAQLEGSAYDLAASGQQGRMDIYRIELRAPIHEIIHARRRPCLARVHIREARRRDRAIVGTRELLAAARDEGAWHDDKSNVKQLARAFR